MKRNFWHNKKVFITGHTGFKGSWLSLWLQSLGAKLTGFSLAPATVPNLFTLANVAENMRSIIGDVRDFNALKKGVAESQPEIVIHLAAQPLVRYSYNNPIETYATNVMGTVHLLEALRQTDGTRAVINVTTDKCYENKEWQTGYRENDRLGGHDPYSNSKACSELVTAAYRSSYFHKAQQLNLATARAGNVIGGGDWAADRLIPDIITGCINKQPIAIRYPHALRPWQYVLEPLNGYLLLAERLYTAGADFAQSWNFGPDEEDIKPVSWLADQVTQLWPNDASWKVDHHAHPHETTYLRLDCAKAKSALGWQPRWGLEKGLQETVNWYRAYYAKETMRDISMAQIQYFIAE